MIIKHGLGSKLWNKSGKNYINMALVRESRKNPLARPRYTCKYNARINLE
jgi:hypothetical protein